jgi:hypothetical protein
VSDEWVVRWPTLGYLVSDWIAAHCVVPDRFQVGSPFVHSDWQLWNTLNHYRVRESAEWYPDNPLMASAFANRRSQTVRPQKSGKSPMVASIVCAEAVGPVLFAGWARGGEAYVCAENGCLCGWVYEYEPGEPMGMCWPTPLIQITATSVEQTDNIYDALRPMIQLGPLAEQIPKTGEEFIRLPNGGRIDVVTSNARSRLGQRVTFCPQDETGLYTEVSGMIKVAETQRRGLAGMGGRAWETTNPWDPSEDSVGQRTWESTAKDIFRDFPQAPAHLSYKNKTERRKIHKWVYAGSPWVDLDAIEAEAFEIMEKDPAQAERFYGNRIVYGAGQWCEGEDWDARHSDQLVRAGTEIVWALDGSDVNDWTAIRAELEDGHQFTPCFDDGTPMVWNPAEHGGQVPRLEVHAAVDLLHERFRVVRAYVDPPYWHTELDEWAHKYGEKIVLPWQTYRPVQMHAACERLVTDVHKKDSGFTHDGCEITGRHVRNAKKAPRPSNRYVLGKPSDAQKIDAAVTSVICHEAAGDATAAGLWTTTFGFYAA